MRRLFALTVTAALVLSGVTWAEEIKGTIRSMDASGRMVTLEDGTQLTIPGNVNVQRKDFQPGADVKIRYVDRGSDKVVTSIEVHSRGAK